MNAGILKIVLLFLFVCNYSIQAACQHNRLQEEQYTVTLANAGVPQRAGLAPQVTNTPPPLPADKASQLKQPSVIKQKLQSLLQKGNNSRFTDSSFRTTGNLCADTSYSRLISVYNGLLYVQSVTQTADGGMLVPAVMFDTTRLPNIFSKGYGLLIRLDGNGNVLWLKQFDELTLSTYNSFYMDRAFELSNGDVVAAGSLSIDGNSSVYKTMVYRLTSSGNIIWKNCLRSTIGVFNSPSGTFTYRVEAATDGTNGDVILCGTSNSNVSHGKIETVARLNNAGQLIWDANYGNHDIDGSYLLGAEGVSAFVQNGQLKLVGLSHGSTVGHPPAVTILTLDYNNGSLLAKRFFKPDYTDPATRFDKSFTYWENKLVRLSDGHFLFHGKLFSDFTNRTAIKDHFGVIEFDASFNLVNAYTLSSEIRTNYSNDQLHFDASGKGVCTILQYIGDFEANVFFGTFNNRQFQNQRKAHYTNTGMPGNNGFAFLKDNGYAYVQSHFQNQPSTKSFVEFTKMHNSDTSSLCLGKDTMLLDFSSLHIIEDSLYPFLDPNEPNKLIALGQTISQTDTLSTTSLNPCKQANYCDTIKIHGNPIICGSTPSITFTAFKNAACGGIVQWDIDRTAIDSLRVGSDSSVTVWFKNNSWQGKLYANLPAGVCHLSAADSVGIAITRGQVPVDLGPDTSLCPGNSILLNAHKGYASYLWQDGSTDSTYSVTRPGLYYVTTTDACGGVFKDSITIRPAPPILFNLGPDRIKCNSDTLHLAAPSGFLNYTWSNNYNINSITSQSVIVNPLIDTAYYIKAEKTPGCFAYDTVHVTVHHSPPIDLGMDKSFCLGDSTLFDAGTGFQSYAWSGGQASQQIVVKATGQYAVVATTAQGCKSSDTVKVLSVYPLPVVMLDKINGLCLGETKTLNAGSFASYQWSTGSTTSAITVSGIGNYAVRVTDANGCNGSDSTSIIVIYPLPSGFLPIDTAICSYGTLQLKPLIPFNKYLWSNGSTTPTITLTQPGLYWLEVVNNNSCKGRDSIIVNPKQCLTGFYVPSAFTPNGDGKNDLFRPMLFGNAKSYHFTIYNRWGQLIFESTDPQKGWDGQLAGVLQTGVFVWTCSYQLEGEEAKSEKGTVVLIR